MPRPTAKSPKLVCAICSQGGIVQSLPKEIDRELFFEEISVPAEPESQKLIVRMMRITYQRDYLCPICGHQWSQTFKTEKQQHV